MSRYFPPAKYGVALFGVLVLPVIYLISRQNYLLFHSLVDGVSIVIAACVFTIVWYSRQRLDNHYFLYLGIAFLFFAFWNSLHLLGNKDMGVLPGYGNLGPPLYIIGRYILSLSLLIAPCFINRKLNTTLMFAGYSLVTLLLLLTLFHWKTFPACIVEGVGLTPFKVVSDYLICLILLGSTVLLLVHRHAFDARVLRLLVAALLLSIATGLAFTLYTDPFGIANMVGHLLQISSFYLIYLAIIATSLTKPQEILYRQLKQNETRLAENLRQLDQANRDLESFAYSVSHDLRAPLRAIEGFSRMLLRSLDGRLNDEDTRRFEVIRENTRRMGQLIDDILAFSRLGSRSISRAPIAMQERVEKVWQELLTINPGRRVSLKLEPLPAAFGDAALITQVLANLLSNAVKFTRQREEALIEVGARTEGGETVYFVRDNGIGFDMRYSDKLFKVFQRLHGEDEFEGTGAGLAIVQRILHRHGGRIWGEGEVDRGATFYFTIPTPGGDKPGN